MKIQRGSKENGSTMVLWPVVAVFVIFLIVIGIIVTLMVQTIKKICPPPPPNTQLALGQDYMGGKVVGWAPKPAGFARQVQPQTEAVTGASGTVDIYAGDTPWSATNWIWSGLLTDMQTNANGLPVEQWTNGMPAQRFYRFNYNP